MSILKAFAFSRLAARRNMQSLWLSRTGSRAGMLQVSMRTQSTPYIAFLFFFFLFIFNQMHA